MIPYPKINKTGNKKALFSKLNVLDRLWADEKILLPFILSVLQFLLLQFAN